MMSLPTLLTLLPLLPQQGPPDPGATCDEAAIEWVLPGQFEEARALAIEERRMILIKGVSFGIDTAGAKCATEGTW